MSQQEKPFCAINFWFSDRRRMGLAAVVCLLLLVLSVLLHNLLSAFFGESNLLSQLPFTMAFVFLSGFAVAFAIWLILWLEKRLFDRS